MEPFDLAAPRATAPDGEAYALPEASAQEALLSRARTLAAAGPTVVVQGLGFVGAAVATAVAAVRNAAGAPRYRVIGIDLPTPSGYWKVARINLGRFPFASPDPDLVTLTRRAVLEDGNLCAACSEEAYALAEVIIIDIPLDVADRTEAEPTAIQVDLAPFREGVAAIGRWMRPDALVLVETTVPIGTTGLLVLPLLQAAFRSRGLEGSPLVAHCYERVMPGPHYLDSIRHFWRSFSGVDAPSAERARAFLETLIDPQVFPLTDLGDPKASELAKLLENSYRAMNIAFIQEWTLAAEALGLDLFSVVDSIRVRKGTHDNMRYPGFGVGGYCLTKDTLLAQWALGQLFEVPVTLDLTLEAMRVNYNMPLHTLDRTRELLGGSLAGRTVALCGISYLAEVPDTRNTPAGCFLDALALEGGHAVCHDPCLEWWPERPGETILGSLPEALAQADAVVFTTPHRAYRNLEAGELLAWTRPGTVIVDAMNVLTDDLAAALHAGGRKVFGIGKGHWTKKGYSR